MSPSYMAPPLPLRVSRPYSQPIPYAKWAATPVASNISSSRPRATQGWGTSLSSYYWLALVVLRLHTARTLAPQLCRPHDTHLRKSVTVLCAASSFHFHNLPLARPPPLFIPSVRPGAATFLPAFRVSFCIILLYLLLANFYLICDGASHARAPALQRRLRASGPRRSPRPLACVAHAADRMPGAHTLLVLVGRTAPHADEAQSVRDAGLVLVEWVANGRVAWSGAFFLVLFLAFPSMSSIRQLGRLPSVPSPIIHLSPLFRTLLTSASVGLLFTVTPSPLLPAFSAHIPSSHAAHARVARLRALARAATRQWRALVLRCDSARACCHTGRARPATRPCARHRRNIAFFLLLILGAAPAFSVSCIASHVSGHGESADVAARCRSTAAGCRNQCGKYVTLPQSSRKLPQDTTDDCNESI
ncbi:hypothetical protein C8J57DRAFT_1647330 [Mycena rebaudengoi]|nr:hypothetical protein C8J57DRAFT_1647330 [Mycena rebaudengoi]